jgi:putative DNA primase/helicase
MQRAEYAARIDAVKQRAHGRWSELLAAAGVEERILRHRNGPCPLCGGTDRFQYTDKFGEGNYHCRGCGPGGGFKLLQAVRGGDFHAALCEVERCLGVLPPAAAAREAGSDAVPGERMRRLVQRIWDEARPVTLGDEVDCYLRGRGLELPCLPQVLRYHPSLGYFEKGADGKSRQIAAYPAMLALVQAPDGHAVTLHRTYLRDGRKLDAPDAKKVLSSGIHGAAVRLFDAGPQLALCEGIETALAVHLATGRPVWAALSAGNLEKIGLPDIARDIGIYADNDAGGDFAGQCYAYALARRLKREEKTTGPRQVRVFVPRHAGTDWADVWCQRAQAPLPATRPATADAGGVRSA